MSLIGFVSSYF